MKIREATLEDCAAISRLISALGYPASDPETTRQRLWKILAAPDHAAWVFENEDGVIGWLHAFVAWRLASPAFAEIGGLVVAPGARRQGAGKALVEQSKAWAETAGLSLRVRCNLHREEAHHFYRACGFSLAKSQGVFTYGG